MSVLDNALLTPDQRAFVEHDEGPLVALSVAGSGKTHALTYRIARLLEKGVPPEEIVAVTFTKKAAGEMAERVAKLVDDEAISSKLNVRTFHSFCYSILRECGKGRKGVAADWQQKKIVQDVLKERGIDEQPVPILNAISWLKNNLEEPDPNGESVKGVPAWIVDAVFHEYEKAKVRQNILDFDDMLVLGLQAVKKRAEHYRKRFPWVLVDEFQDTNVAQFALLKALCPTRCSAGSKNLTKGPNLTVVGDDDQSIYGWRAAKPEFLIQFEETYSDATVVRMQENFRCVEPILNHANDLIHHNEVRVPKRLVAGLDAQKKGNEPSILFGADEDDEASRILEEAVSLHEAEKVDWKDIAVLYRTNAQSRALEDELIRQRIPYQILGGLGFYGRAEVKDLVAYARLAVNVDDDEAFSRVYNRPNRFLGKAALKAIQTHATKRKSSLFAAADDLKVWPRRYMEGKVDEFLGILRSFQGRGGDPGETLKALAEMIGYRAYLAEQGDDDADDSRWENCESLFTAASGFEALGDFVFFAKQAGEKKAAENGRDALTLLTLHRSKGLEWPVVFVAGVCGGLLPHARNEDVEEERRLLYVGMTRARRDLFLGVPAMVNGKPRDVSFFLAETGIASTVKEPTKVETEGGTDGK